MFSLDAQPMKSKRVHFVILNVDQATIHRLSNVKGPVQMGVGIPGSRV